jgi:mannose-6-phosphate isomerase
MLQDELLRSNFPAIEKKEAVVAAVSTYIQEAGYTVAELDDVRPWGAFFRFETSDADRFLQEFFPTLDPLEVRLNDPSAELSPKILIVSPEQRLSWQYHLRRAETWKFLTPGSYKRSQTDEEPAENLVAESGDVVSFDKQERHRLIGIVDSYSLVAEIWQHVDNSKLSDEEDIIRVSDDYKR